MKFETIKGYMKRFNDLIDSCGGPDGMIERGIAWQKVAWGRTFGAGTEYVKIRPRKDAEGVWQLFVKRGKFWKKCNKKDLAYCYDLFDKNGKLLSVLFFSF